MDEQHQSSTEVSEPTESDGSMMDSILPPIKPRRIIGSILKVLAVVIFVAVLIGGVVWLLTKHHATTKSMPIVKASTSQTATTSSPTKISTTIKHYDSSNYNLGFDYPADWTVADEASAKLSVTSPALQLLGTDGQTFPGHVVLTIQNQQTSIAAFAKNTAVASLTSQKIGYSKPTASQRAQTYVTFVSYGGDATTIDALYITGDNGYQVQQSIPQTDVVGSNPLVSVSFQKCADSACKTTATATTIPTSDWSDAALRKPVLALLQSLSLE